jgi:hypothetical protein
MDPKILLIVGGLGLVGCLVLLYMGFNMLREERKAKEAAAPEGPHPLPLPPWKGTTGEGDTQAAGESAPAPASQTAQPAPAPAPNPLMARLAAGMMARMPRGPAGGSAHEVLRVLRDNLTGRIVIELGGQRYSNLADVHEAELRQALQTILTDLDDFQVGAAAVEPLRPIQPPPERLAEPTAPPEARSASLPPARTASPPPARASIQESRPLPKPTMNPFKQMAVLRELSKNPPAPTLTIAEQIDAVLQEHIRSTPLVERGIRVHPGPRGDAVFDLDGESYTGVEQLPDEDVRVVVRAAIAEWEAKQ